MIDDRPAVAASHNYSSLLVTITILVLACGLLLGYQVFSTFRQSQLDAEHAAMYEQRVRAAETLARTQQSTITSLVESYEKAAYSNTEIDRISEQQLLAEEAILGALQIIAIQNSQILQVLSVTP